MNAIQLDPHAALEALAVHMAAVHRLSGPYSPPAWLAQPAIPIKAWAVDGKPMAGKQAREVATLYLFEFKTPQEIGAHTLAGYVLATCDGGSLTSHWWQGQDAQVAACCAATGI